MRDKIANILLENFRKYITTDQYAASQRIKMALEQPELIEMIAQDISDEILSLLEDERIRVKSTPL